jgi:hypothetical protein
VRPVTHIVEFLLGNNWLDRTIADYAQLVFPETTFEHRRVPSELIEKLERPVQANISPLFAFYGPWGSGRQEAARFLAIRQKCPLLIVDLVAFSNTSAEIKEDFQFVLRDGRMYEAMLYLKNWDALLSDGVPNQYIFNALLNYPHMVIVGDSQYGTQATTLTAGQFSQSPSGRPNLSDAYSCGMIILGRA